MTGRIRISESDLLQVLQVGTVEKVFVTAKHAKDCAKDAKTKYLY